jgi:hypothetical protein
MADRRGGLRHETAWIVGAIALLASCAALSSPEPAMSEEPPNSSLPAGAIPTGDNVYMVPLGPDSDGCMQYRMHAPGRAVVQAIFYVDGKGGFTMNRGEADCPPPRSGG